MCTLVIRTLTPIDQTSRMTLYKNNARSRLFCRMAKRSIAACLQQWVTVALKTGHPRETILSENCYQDKYINTFEAQRIFCFLS